MEKRINSNIALFESFCFCLTTGAAAVILGVFLTQLREYYDLSLTKAATISAAFAFGRFISVFVYGAITDKIGAKKVFMLGVVLEMIFFFTIPLTKSYQMAVIVAFIGGAGMSAQDTANPSILRNTFPKTYASVMSIAQAFFGIGCFIPSLYYSILLRWVDYFPIVFYTLGVLCLVLVLLFPKFNPPESITDNLEKDEPVQKGIQLKNFALGLGILIVACGMYCAATNTVTLYSSTFAQTLAISPAMAANLITVYNVGGMIGSFLGAIINRYVLPRRLIWIYASVAVVILITIRFINQPMGYFVGFMLMGMCLGNVYSLFVVTASSLFPTRVAMAAAGVSVTSSVFDTAAPLLTSRLVESHGPSVFLLVLMGLLAFVIVFGFLFNQFVVEEK